MPILDYSYDDPVGYEGQLFGTDDNLIFTAVNYTGYDALTDNQRQKLREGKYEEVYPILQSSGNWLGYGRGVQFFGTATDDQRYELASATNKPIAGISVLVHLYERVGGPEDNGVPPLRSFGLLKRGAIYVYSETAASKYDPVNCRVVATGTQKRGVFRNAAVTNETVLCHKAYYMKTISSPGLVPIYFDFTTNLS